MVVPGEGRPWISLLLVAPVLQKSCRGRSRVEGHARIEMEGARRYRMLYVKAHSERKGTLNHEEIYEQNPEESQTHYSSGDHCLTHACAT